jgi:hypothetical protein
LITQAQLHFHLTVGAEGNAGGFGSGHKGGGHDLLAIVYEDFHAVLIRKPGFAQNNRFSQFQ